MASVNIARGGTPDFKGWFERGDYAEFTPPFGMPPMPSTPPYNSHADAAHGQGFLNLQFPLIPRIEDTTAHAWMWNALKKLSGLEISRICSTHGPVWEKFIPQVVSCYDRLSRYEAEKGVCIVYGSMYGNTAGAAKALAAELTKRGVPHVLHNLCTENVSYAYRDVFMYDTLAVGSPTYNNDIFPPVGNFMRGVCSRTAHGVSVRHAFQLLEHMGGNRHAHSFVCGATGFCRRCAYGDDR